MYSSFVCLTLCTANAYSPPNPNVLHIESSYFQKASWINWLRLRHTDCSTFNWLLFSCKIMRDFYENRRQETHIHVRRTKARAHAHTLFDSSKGNVPVATVRCVIVEFGAPDGPPQPRALCFHITANKNHVHVIHS